ncbi:uncharacterized protein JCM6883_007205 [Sporobolomyces salmoneus]|uniref:uncharacterized protein n=1 Tax=Sporobolomyces salmoneus TaxID=183962 RepID=UPI00317E4B54
MDDTEQQADLNLPSQPTTYPPSSANARTSPSPSILSSNLAADKDRDDLFATESLRELEEEPTKLRRQLKARHIAMISIGGVIGTGLFLGTAQSLQKGPVAVLLAYCLMATLVYSMMISLGEMISHLPISGGHLALASRFVDPAFGFAVGWTYTINWLLVFPTELSAAAVLVSFWSNANPAGWIAICYVIFVLINFGGPRVYGEVEYVAAVIKVLTIIVLLIVGIVIASGGVSNGDEAYGFAFWRSPGTFNTSFLGITSPSLAGFASLYACLTQSAYAFIGSEIVSLAAGEAKNPSRSLPRAIHRVLFRIALFYIAGVFIIGLIVAYDDPALGRADGTALSSPFVIAIHRAGIRGLPSIANAAFLISATSAASSGLYVASRSLFGLAVAGQAPLILAKTNRYGLPFVSVAVSSAFGLLSFLSAGSDGAGRVFTWLSNCCSVGGVVSWAAICFTFVRFYYGARAQRINRIVFPYRGRFQPFAAIYALCGFSLLLVTQGFEVFVHGHWSTSTFITRYLMIVLSIGVYVSARFYWKTSFVPLTAIDFFSGSRDHDESEERSRSGFFAKLWHALS